MTTQNTTTALCERCKELPRETTASARCVSCGKQLCIECVGFICPEDTELRMSRACQEGRHIGYVSPIPENVRIGNPYKYLECQGEWTSYPESSGPCECTCHEGAK